MWRIFTEEVDRKWAFPIQGRSMSIAPLQTMSMHLPNPQLATLGLVAPSHTSIMDHHGPSGVSRNSHQQGTLALRQGSIRSQCCWPHPAI